MTEFVCRNCGQCCGPVPIVEKERQRIEKFLKKHPSIRILAHQKPFSTTCVFRDSEKGCLIYSSRPKLCRAYQCSSLKWFEEFKNPPGSPRLINECFGAACDRESYSSMREDIFNSASQMF